MKYFLLLLLSVFSIQSHAQTQWVEVAPEVGEWKHNLCTLATNSHYSARCQAAGGTYQGLHASPSCVGADVEAFALLEPVEQAQEFAKYAYSGCSERTPEFSGWGQTTYDSYCGGPTGPKYKFGIESGNTGHVNLKKNDTGEQCRAIGVTRNRDITCPAGSIQNDIGNGSRCYQQCQEGETVVDGQCVSEPSTPPIIIKVPPCSPINPADKPVSGNPCDYRTGAKYRHETDFSQNGFTLTRHYHSQHLINIGFGVGWHNGFFKRLSISGDSLLIIEGTGRTEPWEKDNGTWQGDADSDYLLTETSAGFTITLKRGDVHEYNLAGLLLSETDTQGKVTTYGYDAQDRLTTVTHYYGQSITFEYSSDGKNHITKVTDTSGVEYGYEYDANDNLIAVVYPDSTTDTSDNPRRIYHYEDSRFPNNITGITNVDGDRYATFSYNDDGRAIESALAPTTNSVGQERVQLEYTGHSSNNSSSSN